MWDPEEEYWGEKDEPVDEWALPIIAYGPRPMYEMEQVLPGEDPEDPFDDPITRSNDLMDAGERAEAIRILMELCRFIRRSPGKKRATPLQKGLSLRACRGSNVQTW